MYLAVTMLALVASTSAPVTLERIEVQGRAPLKNSTIVAMDEIYQPGMTLAQALRQVPGLYVRQDAGPGAELSLSLQGSATSQVLVLLDGEPLTSSTLGTPLLQQLDPAEITSVEIIHGGAAAAYGAGAMAGVLNIRTHAQGAQVLAFSAMRGASARPEERQADGWHGYLRLSQALTQKTDLAVSLGKRAEHSALQARQSGSRPSADAFYPAYDTDHASIELAHRQSDHRQLRVSHRLQNSAADYAQACYDAETFVANPCEPWLQTRQHLTRVEQSVVRRDQTTRFSLSYLNDNATSYDHLTDQATWSGSAERYSTQRWRAAYVNERHLSAGGMVTRGAEWQREYAGSNSVRYRQQSRARLALFNHYVAQNGSGIGFRAERLGSGSWVLAADLQQAVALSERSHALFKLSNGYREPSFNDLYWPSAGNPELRRERSQSAQLELRHDVGDGHLSLRTFYQRWRDLITWAPVAEGSLWAPQNIAQASSLGMTLGAAQPLSPRWSLEASVTVQQSQDDDNNSRLAMRPRQLGQLALNYRLGRWRASMTAHGRDNIVTNTGERLAGYVSYAATLQWQMNDQLSLSLQGDNLADHSFSEGGEWYAAGRQLRLAAVWRH